MRWDILTPEYLPSTGGVAGYTRQVADALAAAGDEVEVWAPSPAHGTGGNVLVRALPDAGGWRARRALHRAGIADAGGERRLLVQYVPSYGRGGLNLPLAYWLARRRPAPWVMYHEVAFPLEPRQSPWRHCLARGTRHMAAVIHAHAARAFVTIPAWSERLRELAPDGPTPEVLAVPSNLALEADPAAVSEWRRTWKAETGWLAGYFGHSQGYAARLFRHLVPQLLASEPRLHLLLAGSAGSCLRQQVIAAGGDGTRIHAPGYLSAEAAAAAVAAVDLMLQPYPDGVSGRRTSAIASLPLGRALLTTAGELTEPFWQSGGAVALQPVLPFAELVSALAARTLALLRHPDERARLGARAPAFYREHFALEHTLSALRRPAPDAL